MRVTPRASRNQIQLSEDNVLLVRITAAPVDNAANIALVTALAKALHVPKSAIRIVGGQTSRSKLVEIDLGLEQIRERLAP